MSPLWWNKRLAFLRLCNILTSTANMMLMKNWNISLQMTWCKKKQVAESCHNQPTPIFMILDLYLWVVHNEKYEKEKNKSWCQKNRSLRLAAEVIADCPSALQVINKQNWIILFSLHINLAKKKQKQIILFSLNNNLAYKQTNKN